jgi:uncharacterized protein YkwD
MTFFGRFVKFICVLWLIIIDLSIPSVAEPYQALMQRLLAQGQAQALFQPAIENRLAQLVNGYRRGRGLNVLVEAPKMKGAARAHAADMALHNRLGHVASSGHDFDSRMHALRPGQMILPALGENAAMMSGALNPELEAQQLFKSWLASPPHLHTLSSRDYVGFATGVAVVGGRVFADQIFIGPEVQSNMTFGSRSAN